jgi:hypothetical protein
LTTTLCLTAFILISQRASGEGFYLSVKDEGRKSFYLAVGDHYRAPEAKIAYMKKKGIKDDEMPVVLHVAAKARVEPEKLVEMRLKGQSWADISLKFGLGAEIFHVPLEKDPGPPYGKAYGYFKKHPKSEWNKIKLSDDEIKSMVNLQFIAKRHSTSVDEVVKIGAGGSDFVAVFGNVKRHKHAKRKCNAVKATQKKMNKACRKKGKGKKQVD